jgi:hypothetical protein
MKLQDIKHQKTPKVQSTVLPDRQMSFNEWAKYIRQETAIPPLPKKLKTFWCEKAGCNLANVTLSKAKI